MAQLGPLITFSSDKDLHFTEAIAQNAAERENLSPPMAVASGNFNRTRCRIVALKILSVENLAWELNFFGRDTFETELDIDRMSFIARWAFDAASGLRIGGAGPYMYYIDGLNIPFEDADETGEFHVALVNRSAAGKSAGAAGAIVVSFIVDTLAAV